MTAIRAIEFYKYMQGNSVDSLPTMCRKEISIKTMYIITWVDLLLVPELPSGKNVLEVISLGHCPVR